MTARDAKCLTCGRRGPWEVVYLKPNPSGGQHEAMGLCSAKCRREYASEERRTA